MFYIQGGWFIDWLLKLHVRYCNIKCYAGIKLHGNNYNVFLLDYDVLFMQHE